MKVARAVWILTKFKRIVRDGEEAKIEAAKAAFEEKAKKIKKIEAGNVTANVEYTNFKATVTVKGIDNIDNETVEQLVGSKTGLFSTTLPELGVKSVKIGDKSFTVDPKHEKFDISGMISAAISELDKETMTITYDGTIETNGVEFTESFTVKFKLAENNQ